MSTLQVANLVFESTANNRIQYIGSNTITISTAGNEDVRIDASGNFGIGTTSPTTKLDVVGDGLFRSTPNTFISISAGDGGIEISRNGGGAYIDFKNTASEDYDCRIQSAGTNGDLDFYSGSTQRMRIDASGSVGIGTTSPSSYGKFAVRGYILSGGQNYSASFSDAVNSTLGISHQSGIANFICDQAIGFYTASTERARIDSSGNLRFNSGYGSVATAYGCRAWANWDGRSTGTITPRASGGVTSVTKITTGSYSINFNFTMPDVNYSVSGAVGNTAYSSGSVAALAVVISNMTTTYANVFTVSHASNSIDFQYVNVSIVR